MSATPFYVTTPIYYVNDVPHIGAAYTTLACDVLARFARLDGRPVRFLTGTDEHGQKVEQAAQKAGEDPQAFTDRVSQSFRDLVSLMNYSVDDFIRTTEERHQAGVRALWQRLADAGQIYLGSYAGWYAQRDEAFYAEDETTLMPDGTRLAPSGAACAWVEEPSYFFRLSDWGEKLLDLYESQPDFIGPSARRNEIVSFVRGGLRDLSVSRTSFSWGVKVPGDPAHVVYVWLDALANYMTALGYPDESGAYQQFWPADLHMVGKDILRFHAVYWPAFLLAAGLPLPRRIFAHGWWTAEGEKMSKSLGNVISPGDLVGTFGLDATRFYLLRAFPFGNDGDFSRKAMIERVNADLANGHWQPGAANAVAGGEELRRPHAGDRQPVRGRQGAAVRGGATAGHDAAGTGRAGLPQGTRRALRDRRPCRWLHRPPGAVGAAQDRPGAHGGGAQRAVPDIARPCDLHAALHARCHGQAADPSWAWRRRTAIWRAWQHRSRPEPRCRRRKGCSRA